MVPRKLKEYSNEMHAFVIKHFWNRCSEKDIAQKVLILCTSAHNTTFKYKSTKFIRNLIGCGRTR